MRVPSPLRLSQFTILGSAMILAAYLLSFLPFPEGHLHGGLSAALRNHWPELLCMTLPFLIGGTLCFASYRQLTFGIRNDHWTEAELETARQWIGATAFTWAQIVIFPVFFGLWLIIQLRHLHQGMSFLILYASFPIGWLRAALRKPREASPQNRWQTLQPIQSEHWGQQPNS